MYEIAIKMLQIVQLHNGLKLSYTHPHPYKPIMLLKHKQYNIETNYTQFMLQRNQSYSLHKHKLFYGHTNQATKTPIIEIEINYRAQQQVIEHRSKSNSLHNNQAAYISTLEKQFKKSSMLNHNGPIILVFTAAEIMQNCLSSHLFLGNKPREFYFLEPILRRIKWE